MPREDKIFYTAVFFSIWLIIVGYSFMFVAHN